MSIRIVTEPRVFLVGSQDVDSGAIGDFLHAEGVEDWTTDTDIAGQSLVECAGRLCYMSFKAPRPVGGHS